MEAKLTSYYTKVENHYAAKPLPILTRRKGIRMPRSRILLIEQRIGEDSIHTFEPKQPIGLYRRLDGDEEGKGDEATAVAVQQLDCAHFRNFARNFSPEEVEGMDESGATEFYPTLNEKILAQYFVELHLRKKKLSVIDRLERMRLLMPYRTNRFLRDLFNVWNVPSNKDKFTHLRSTRLTRGKNIETHEHYLNYSTRT